MLNDIRNNEALAFNKIAEKYGVSNTFLNDLFDKKVDLKRLPLPDVLSIDEVHAKKLSKTKFCCVLYDFMNRQIVDILDCRHKNFLIDYLSRITKKERNNVKFVSMDMWDAYRDVSKLCFPDAVIVCDSFHVIQKMGRDYTHLRVRIQNRFYKQDHTKLYYKLIKKYTTFMYKNLDLLINIRYNIFYG